MRRIESGGFPAPTRLLLRERLSRFLPHPSTTDFTSQGPARAHLADAELVALLLNLQVTAGDDVTGGRLVYEQALQAHDADQRAAVGRDADSDASTATVAGEPAGPAPVLATSQDVPAVPEPGAQDGQPSVTVSVGFAEPALSPEP